MKKLVLGFVFFGFVFGLVGGCASTVREGKCLDDADCNGGKCVGGKCEGGNCTVDADCPTGQACKSGKCEPTTTPAACNADADCKAPTPLCQNGKCVECKTDSDCKDAAKPSCKANVCVATSTPEPECSATKACPTGKECKDGKCVDATACPSTDILLNGKCYRVSKPEDPKCYTVQVDSNTVAFIGEEFRSMNRVASKDQGGDTYNYNDQTLTSVDKNDPRIVFIFLDQVPYKYYLPFFKSADGKTDRWTPNIHLCVKDGTKAELIDEPKRPGVKTTWMVNPKK